MGFPLVAARVISLSLRIAFLRLNSVVATFTLAAIFAPARTRLLPVFELYTYIFGWIFFGRFLRGAFVF
uniref:Uncharacterized protein n=1 Tax=Rhizophora mucronata TaxID=61149 RepID=A0A2P2QAT2_RHIMU